MGLRPILQLAVLLDWQPTGTVADIGAGHGQLTVAVAKHVGEICSTELDDKLPSATRRRPKAPQKTAAHKACRKNF